jgi:hypothetical protein
VSRDEEPLDLLTLAYDAGCVVLVDARGGVEIVPDPREATDDAAPAPGGVS